MSKVEGVADPYARITGRILEQLEQGVRPWTKPWSADHLGGRVTRPLRSTGEAYQGINVLLLWMEAVAAGHGSPTWMTYRQALALGGQVRKGERGCPVVYFGTLAKGSADRGKAEGGSEEDGREVRFLKTYTVFNVAQIDGLSERFTPAAAQSPPLPAPERIAHADAFLGALGIEVATGAAKPSTRLARTGYSFRRWKLSMMSRAITRRGDTSRFMRLGIRTASTATSNGGGLAMKAMRGRNWSPSWGAPSSRPTSAYIWSRGRTTPPIWRAGSRCCRATSGRSSRPPPTPSAR